MITTGSRFTDVWYTMTFYYQTYTAVTTPPTVATPGECVRNNEAKMKRKQRNDYCSHHNCKSTKKQHTVTTTLHQNNCD